MRNTHWFQVLETLNKLKNDKIDEKFLVGVD